MQLAHAVLAGSIFPSMPRKWGDQGISPLGPPSPTGGLLFRTTGVARKKRSNQLRTENAGTAFSQSSSGFVAQGMAGFLRQEGRSFHPDPVA
jgi:hypothetical protein